MRFGGTRHANAAYRILRVERGVVRVEDAHGMAPTIPFWLGEAPGRGDELSHSVSRLRATIDAGLTRLAEAVGDGLADQGMVGNLAFAVQVFGASELVGKDRGDQVFGAHAGELRRHFPAAAEAPPARRRPPSASG
jgi:hypothetical protein